jgi:predicted ester cyclase
MSVALMERPQTLTQEQLIRDFWDNLINKRDAKAWQALAHPDITFQGSLASRVWEGYEGIIQYAPLMFNRFDDFSLKVGDIITQGNKSAVELTFSGLNTAGLFGSPPCGKRVTYNAVGIITVENGKISKVRVTGNVIQIMEQMGHQV